MGDGSEVVAVLEESESESDDMVCRAPVTVSDSLETAGLSLTSTPHGSGAFPIQLCFSPAQCSFQHWDTFLSTTHLLEVVCRCIAHQLSRLWAISPLSVTL